MQIINVIRRFLDDPEAGSPTTIYEKPYNPSKKLITPGDYTPVKRQTGDLQAVAARDNQRTRVLNKNNVVEIEPNVDYVEFYRRVKEFGADRKWTD